MSETPKVTIDRAYLLAGNQSLKSQLAENAKQTEALHAQREHLLGALAYNEALLSTQPEAV